MKIDSTDIGVFSVKVSYEDGAAFLLDKDAELVDVNGAIDEAVSFAGTYGTAYILIELAPKPEAVKRA